MIAAAVLSLCLTDARLLAQSFTVLYTFNQSDGETPNGDLFRDSAGNLYGTTAYGGSSGFGTVFKLDQTGKLTTLHQFIGTPTDGSYPNGHLVRDAGGNLYGTTSQGGTSNVGTIFGMNVRTGEERVLYNFIANSSDGMWPYAGLTRDAAGNFYGVASVDGLYGGGIIFQFRPGHRVHVLHNFSGNSTDGMYPYGVLLLTDGKLYGTTSFGGTSNLGTLFVLDDFGERVLYDFADTAGEFPYAGVIRDSAGNIYGTTQYGGNLSCNALSSGCGAVFKRDANGHQTVLYSFLGSPDGDDAASGLVMDNSGNLYGATTYGGTGTCQNTPFMGCGTLFRVDQNGEETVLFNFTGGADGTFPLGALIRDSAGNLYGSTRQGGQGCNGNGCGTVFKLTP